MYYIIIFLIMALVVTISGYFFVVLREKYYLKNNVIIIDNNNLTDEDFKGLDISRIYYRGIKLKPGDELKIKTAERIYKCTLIGGKQTERTLKIITNTNEIIEVEMKNIKDIKMIREYGKFFTV